MPRIGMGMPIIGGATEAAVLAVEDFVFLNDVSGELTPVDTSSRTNLLLQSQTFKTTWTTNNAAIPNDLYKAPDDSLTAQAITATSAGASSVFLQQIVATTSGETYTYSLHAKKAANGFVSIQFGDGTTTRKAWFNLSTGAATNTSNILTSSFDKMDDDWVRISFTFQATSTTSSSFVRIFSAAAAGSTATGAAFDAGTELLYIWGAQLEEDSRPTAYIVTTNAVVNAVTTELNDFSNVWDFDGTDIMLQVDPDSEGAFEEATANLITNHDFATDSDWIKQSNWTISGGLANSDGSSGYIKQNSVVTNNKIYKISFTAIVTGGQFRAVTTADAGTYTPYITSSGSYVFYINPTVSIAGGFEFISDSFTGSIDNVSVKEYAITPLDV